MTMKYPIFNNAKSNNNIGFYVSPNQDMKQVNIVVDYLSQFGNVVFCTNDYVAKDLKCLVLPDLSNIIALGGTIDANFVNFFNKYISNINIDNFDFPIIGYNHSCLSLYEFIGGKITSVTGHFKAGEGNLHLLNITKLPSILKLFPTLQTIHAEKVKIFSSTVHVNCMDGESIVEAERIAWNGINESCVLEGFLSYKFKIKMHNDDKKDLSSIRFIGLQSLPWLKTNFKGSFDYKVSGLNYGDHLSNSILYHLTR